MPPSPDAPAQTWPMVARARSSRRGARPMVAVGSQVVMRYHLAAQEQPLKACVRPITTKRSGRRTAQKAEGQWQAEGSPTAHDADPPLGGEPLFMERRWCRVLGSHLKLHSDGAPQMMRSAGVSSREETFRMSSLEFSKRYTYASSRTNVVGLKTIPRSVP